MPSPLPPMQRKNTRGLSGKRGLSKQKLTVANVNRRTSAGSYLNKSLLPVSKPTEPQFLAGPSTHVQQRSSVSVTSSVHCRSGLRGRTNLQPEGLVRKESLTSMESSSGHSSSTDESQRRNGVTTVRPRLDREISSLGESQASFFSDPCDDYGDSASSTLPPSRGSEMNLPPRPRESAMSNVSSTTNRRTFEDMSLEAQYVDGSSEGEKNYEMEISPGVYLPFRGPQETWRAVADGNILESFCLECSVELVSVPDCQCIVCPECNTCNPVFEHPAGVHPDTVRGVGMGLQKKWVVSRKTY